MGWVSLRAIVNVSPGAMEFELLMMEEVEASSLLSMLNGSTSAPNCAFTGSEIKILLTMQRMVARTLFIVDKMD